MSDTVTDLPVLQLRPNHQAFVTRFVKACRADDRVAAVFLGGSNIKGTADQYSDIDLCIITTENSYEDFFNQRESFLRSLGELVFLEDFEIPNIAFFIFADGVEGELYFGSENHLNKIHSGPYRVLIDKKDILAGAVFPEDEPDPSHQIEELRRNIYWFWHELSHFIAAMGREQLWWARGQLDELRHLCVKLARLDHNFQDDAKDEGYFKIEKAMPTEKLAALEETFCPMEKNGMLQSARVITRFFQDMAPPLAEAHDIKYPLLLERVMLERLESLAE